jgi:PAS domain S-box-containing protein
MNTIDRARAGKYAVPAIVAIGAPAAAMGIGLAAGLEGRSGVVAMFFVAVLIATLVGGLAFGLLAVIVSYVPLAYFFIAPLHSFAPQTAGVIALGAFVVGAVLMAIVLDGERRSRQSAVVALEEQRRLAGALAKSEEHLVRTLEETETGSWEWDIRSDEMRWSENLGPIHGLARGEQPASNEEYLALVHPEDRPRLVAAIEAALEEGTGYEIELRTQPASGYARWIWAQASVIAGSDGRPHRVVGIMRDVTERKRREDNTEFLASATEALSVALDYDGTVAEVARLAVPRLADWFDIDLEEGERLSELHPELADEEIGMLTRDPAQMRAVRELGPRSAMIVPLRAGGRRLGTAAFASALTRRRYDREDLSFAEEFARRAALAIESARAYQAEQQARAAAERANDRLRKLEAVAQVGLAAHTLDDLLDDLLPLSCDLFEADRAAVLLVDEERQELWMRAAHGLDEAVKAKVRVPIGRGIAGTIASSGKALLVDDVSSARPQSAYLQELGGSLIGVPLKAEGNVIGVLHVSSDRRAAFEDRDLRLLTLAGERVALALELISLYEREHETAVTLQRSVLPEQMPAVEHVQLAARYVPGSTGVEVGGDWYDALELGPTTLGIVVGDVVGKGVLAAATMTQLRNALRVYALEGLRPASVLSRLNRLADTAGPSFATLLYAIVDTESLVCRYASAGHPPPLLVRSEGSAPEFLEGGRSVPLGVQADVGYRQDAVTLEPGDTLILYTDGLVERRGISLDEGLETLERSACESMRSLEELLDHIVGQLLEGESPTDDVAVLALRAVPDRVATLAQSFPSEPSSLAEMRSLLREWLVEHGVPERIGAEIVLACSEACANALEHARAPSRAEFEVAAERLGDEIVIRIRDFGHWREPRDEPDRGFGFRLIEEMMDGVEVRSGDGGTEVELRRSIETPLVGASR